MADDALTDADREALEDWWESGGDLVTEWGMPGLYAVVEKITRRARVDAYLDGYTDALTDEPPRYCKEAGRD